MGSLKMNKVTLDNYKKMWQSSGELWTKLLTNIRSLLEEDKPIKETEKKKSEM